MLMVKGSVATSGTVLMAQRKAVLEYQTNLDSRPATRWSQMNYGLIKMTGKSTATLSHPAPTTSQLRAISPQQMLQSCGKHKLNCSTGAELETLVQFMTVVALEMLIWEQVSFFGQLDGPCAALRTYII